MSEFGAGNGADVSLGTGSRLGSRAVAVLTLTLTSLSCFAHAEAAASEPHSPEAPMPAASSLVGQPIDEAYRKMFETCDATDRFGDVQLPIKRFGHTVWYGCKSDPSRFARLEKLGGDSGPVAVLWEAKAAEDLDGSPAACTKPGITDQCTTSLMLAPTATHPCPKATRAQGGHCLPVDAEAIPYVVIPDSAPKGMAAHEFKRITGVGIGDLAVVVLGGKVVPALVADTGPAYKIGEGSRALLARLSDDGKARPISRGVVVIAFPGSRSTFHPAADSLAADVEREAMNLYHALRSP